jgi:Uri superfamily endonuclease
VTDYALVSDQYPWSKRLPKAAGSYALIFELIKAADPIVIGKLGSYRIDAPLVLLYCGSAFGAGGIASRVAHHLSLPNRPHWHLDYLRPVLKPLGCVCAVGERLECAWAQSAGGSGGSLYPIPGFGAADCRSGCLSHLIGFRDLAILAEVCAELPARKRLDFSEGWLS